MSAAAKVLDRLQRVRRTGVDRWVACCPSHADRSPSLSVREIDDRLLVHCFAGCEVGDVLAALGLEVRDLFDRPLSNADSALPPSRSRIPATDVLLALDHEITAAAILIEGASSYPLNDLARDRLDLIVSRIKRAIGYVRALP